MNDDLKKSIIAGLGVDPKLLDGDTQFSTCFTVESVAPDPCPKCGSEMKLRRMALSGPYSGGVQCTVCSYRDSVVGYLGKQMVKVEPLPDGADLVYSEDSQEEND